MTARATQVAGDVHIEAEPRRPETPIAGAEAVASHAPGDGVLMLTFAGLSTMAATAVGACSLVVAMALRLDGGIGAGIEPYRPVFWFAGGVRGLLFLIHRHHRNRRCRGSADEIAEAVREATVGSLALVVFTFFWRGGSRYRAFSYSRSVFVADWLLTMVGLSLVLLAGKGVLAQLRRRGQNRRVIAIVGDSPAAEEFVSTIADHPEMGYEVALHLGAPRRDGRDFVAELSQLAPLRGLDAVVLATDAVGRTDISRLVGLSQFRTVDVHAVPELFGLAPTKVSLCTVGPFPMLSLLQDPIQGPRRLMKRALDVVGSFVALLILGPVMAAAALAVRLSSPGPILFTQDRVGMDGRPFRMLKFRTMHVGASADCHRDFVVSFIRGHGGDGGAGHEIHKLIGDSRITRPGRVLRRLSIDELPQLFNVLRGDMSLVGPRPSLPYEAEAYDDWHRRRFDVRPGMTGLWQVSGRSRLTYDEMVKLDLTYIETWSPARDLVILARTIPAIFRREST